MGRKQKNFEKPTPDRFSLSYDKMIATSIDAYKSVSSSNRAGALQYYTRERIEQIIADGDPEELKELSRAFFYHSGFYRMLILYYSCFLDYSLLTIPKTNHKTSISQTTKNAYNNAMDFIDNLKVKEMFVKFALRVFVDGAYYGLLTYENGIANVIDLPFEYCRCRFKNFQGIDIIEFNLRYFDGISNKEKRIACLKSYPDDVRRAYNNFKNRQGDNWYLVPPEYSIHFAFFEERPLFSDIIPATLDFEDYRELEKNKDQQDLYKVLIQEMPHTNDGELVFDPEEVGEMHRGISKMIKNRNGIDFVTSFGSMKVVDMQANRSVVTNNLEKISNSIYSEAGVSKEIFSADNSTSLNRSLQKDMSIAMYLGRQFSHWLEFVINENFQNKNTVSFSVKLLPITFYNREDMIKNSFSGVQYGYSFLIPFIALGVEQHDVRDLKILENKILELDKVMTPLASANTVAAGEKTIQQGREEAEAKGTELDNKKPDGQKAEQTVKNIESGGGNG